MGNVYTYLHMAIVDERRHTSVGISIIIIKEVILLSVTIILESINRLVVIIRIARSV